MFTAMLATPRAETSERVPELDGIRGVAVSWKCP